MSSSILYLITALCRTTIHIGQGGEKKEVQEDAKSVIVKLRPKTDRKEHLLHEKYNTKHEVFAIGNVLCAETRGSGGKPNI